MSGEYAFFEKLVGNTQLDSKVYADASGKHERVRRCLNRYYYKQDSGTANSFLVGSYGKNTEIKPPSDLDILFQLPETMFRRFSNRTGNIQSQLLQEVKGVLENTFSTTNIKGDGQVVSVPFATYAIEVLPAFLLDNGKYLHADSNGGGMWKTTDPVMEMRDLTKSNTATGGKTIHLVKLAKAWKATRRVHIKSFVLELAAVRFLAQWQHNLNSTGALTGYTYYDWMMRDFFKWLQNRTNEAWYLPGIFSGFFLSEGEHVRTGDEWAAQARFAANSAERACEHHYADRLEAAIIEWRNIFGEYTP